MAASPLPNYLRTHRKRWALSQKQLVHLLGFGTCSPVSKYERNLVLPSLKTVLAYEIIFGEPARALFPGEHLAVEEAVMRRALVLYERLEHRTDLAGMRQHELVLAMLARTTDQPKHAPTCTT